MNTNKAISRVIAVAGAAALFSSMSFAQSSGGSNTSTSGGNGAQTAQDGMKEGGMKAAGKSGGQVAMDKKFVHTALQGGMAEVKMGQLASQKSSNDAVKNFGQKMVDDHTKMGEDMKPIAQKLGVPLPTKLDAKDQALFTRLSAMSGTEFDNAYIKAMVKDHKKDDAEFKTEAQNAADPDLKQVVTKGEQTISEHLQMIQDIAKSNNVASK